MRTSAVAAAVAACSASPGTTLPPSRSAATDPVDVADPQFVYLDGGQSSTVDAAFYDAGTRYMIISLDGTAYHCCAMSQSTWSQFTAASSLGSFYRDLIKGSYDCRTGLVPQYSAITAGGVVGICRPPRQEGHPEVALSLFVATSEAGHLSP